MAYCDDLKPSISCMAEFKIIDESCSYFKRSSGCLLHRDPASGKCKILALGRWKSTLQQEDIPLNYMVLTDSLDMVGLEMKSTWVQTRKANGDILQTKVSNIINAWKSGKFMDLICRPWSVNTYALSKVWFKCHTVDLRVLDISSISSMVKSWIFQDQLEKPQEMILHRPIYMGGIGLHNVKYKALASMIKTFLETAAHPSFHHSHCFFHCDNTRVMGGKLLSAISPHYPLITLSKLLRLDFEAEPAMEMPLVWVTAHTLLCMCGVRCSGKTVNPLLTRASLESKRDKI